VAQPEPQKVAVDVARNTARTEAIATRAGLISALKVTRTVRRASIGTILTDVGAVDEIDVREAIAEQLQHPDMRVGDLLVERGKVREPDLYRALGEQMGVPYVHLGDFDVDPSAIAMLTHDLARARRFLPLMFHRERLVVATDDPADSNSLSALRFLVQRPIETVLASPSDLDAAIAKHYPPFADAELHEEAERLRRRQASETESQSPEQLAAQKPIVRLVHNLLLNAVQRRASDIHLRPREGHAEARYRIDGSLLLVGEISASLMLAVVARIKVMSSLDVTERRLPQDGAIHIDTPHGEVDLRVSIIPAIYGENVVIRILDRSVGLRRLDDIGFDSNDRKRMRDLIGRNQGLVLVTGPTGSGKSTTLYAALQELNNGEYQIVTVEDPVEYRLDGLVQIQTQPKIGWGFPEALRHILRHDPDVILIGEIRDAETAKAAIESALTGHLVFSTLHTNSAAQSVTRLLEIGIPAYLVNATLAGVLAQRLARRNCEHCKAPEPVSPELCAALGVRATEKFWRGTGCEECSGTGYRGRVAAYELLQTSPALRRLISERASHERLEEQAIKEGMTRLTDQALVLARAGTISLDEVMRVRLE